MPAAHRILVFKSCGEPCSTSSCDQLVATLSHSFPSAKIQLASGVKEELPNDLALVVLQSQRAEDLVRRTEELSTGKVNTPMLAVICGMDEPDKMPLQVLRSLDDYICCPFRLFEFLLECAVFCPAPRIPMRRNSHREMSASGKSLASHRPCNWSWQKSPPSPPVTRPACWKVRLVQARNFLLAPSTIWGPDATSPSFR